MFLGFLKKMGADMIVNMQIAEDFALLESQKEFVERFKSHLDNPTDKSLPMLASSCPGKLVNHRGRL